MTLACQLYGLLDCQLVQNSTTQLPYKRSLGLDIKILAKTILAVLKGSGAA
jgi:lipopolysaccharide/colanic/teichoic acid biosynthesis glycosyltransferase